MKIGIIVAMEEEMNAINKYVIDASVEKLYNLEFTKGIINGVNVIICKCGIGKVNAARTTQILIDKYSVDYIINVGVAGGVNSCLNIGDIVIGKTLVQHDFDITKFGHEKGFITGVGKEIHSDEKLIKVFKDNFPNNTIVGTIASGDIFCTEPKMSIGIHKIFKADCVEMEGAAIAQVCFLCKVPFIIIRSISDVVNGSNEVDFDKFINSSSEIVSKELANVISKIGL